MKNITPIKRSKKQARQFYNRTSGIYDWLTASEKPLIEKGIQALSPQADEYVIEIGCGTGLGLALINKTIQGSEGKAGVIIGLDISHQMLIESQEKSTADLLQGDATNLPMKNDLFDALFCSFTLELFSEEDMPIVLGEIRRVLKPSGRLVLIALVKPPNNLAVRLYEFAHRLFPVAIDCRPIPLKQILTKNGFKIESDQQFMNWGLPVGLVRCKPV